MNKRTRDISGGKFGRLTVVNFSHVNRFGHSHWHCICECGSRRIVAAKALNNGGTKSCGCLNRDNARRKIRELRNDPIFVAKQKAAARRAMHKHRSKLTKGLRIVAKTEGYRNKASLLLAGVRKTTVLTARGMPEHPKARHISVCSPTRRVYQIDNIAEFVRAHPDLFDPADTVEKSSHVGRNGTVRTYRAAQGISSLCRKVNTRLSWKGWTLVSINDRRAVTPVPRPLP